jgi:dihydrofolate reductase
VTLVLEDAAQFVEQLKQQPGKGIWLCGGANLASTLFSAGLIDRLILKVNPFLMGEGIPLFSDVIPQTALTLTDHKIYENGVVILHYQIDPLRSH